MTRTREDIEGEIMNDAVTDTAVVGTEATEAEIEVGTEAGTAGTGAEPKVETEAGAGGMKKAWKIV